MWPCKITLVLKNDIVTVVYLNGLIVWKTRDLLDVVRHVFVTVFELCVAAFLL